jgi:hypothetical protein
VKPVIADDHTGRQRRPGDGPSSVPGSGPRWRR